jgi:hypothetical protein
MLDGMWFADLKIDQGGLVIHDLQVKNIALLSNGFQASHQRKGVANSHKKKMCKPLSQVHWKQGDSHVWRYIMCLFGLGSSR